MKLLSSNKAFGGVISKYSVSSISLGLAAEFNVFLPHAETVGIKFPVLYYLAGLTCNPDTGAQKGGFLQIAAEEKLAIVFPDTSARGAGIDGEDKDWDFGTGAGFYLNATKAPYSKSYKMYDYIVKELPALLAASELSLDLTRSSIFGHSMGGHGALTLYLRNLNSSNPYRSASAFAPICNPSNSECAWGKKAFEGYLTGGVEEGVEWDATELLQKAKGNQVHILADVGLADDFYNKKQLLPENFITAAKSSGFTETEVEVNMREGYDHSYWFISTFAANHIKFHAKHLKA